MTNVMERAGQWLGRALGLTAEDKPFPWQERLLARFLEGRIPSSLDIPTGLGKTAVMAVWLVARALGADVPRRLVYVVDRRVVVDQATEVAEALRAWVEAESGVKSALGLTRELPISTLRGQHVDNRAWLEDPTAPAIILGTIDMVGSRLLFGGYGVSRRMRPYHAGLLGCDSLLVLDEAHLVPAFERLVARIACRLDARGRPLGPVGTAAESLVPPLRLLSLSATGRGDGADIFRLSADDDLHPVVRRRMLAAKRLHLRAGAVAKELPEALADAAWALAGEGRTPQRILVFCNSRDHARKVLDALTKLAKRPDAIATELLVGGRRVHEREQAARRLHDLGFVAGSGVSRERPAFVIATAAGEVGVDLDADHAVVDLVAWERMVQRLGRVNRRGLGTAQVIVIPQADASAADAARLDAVRSLLESLPSVDGAFDASPAALVALRADPERQALMVLASTPAPLHPPLLRATVDDFAMTSLDAHAGRPELAPWIRGWPTEPEAPRTTVAWRRWLPVTDDGNLLVRRELEAFREAADPHLAEQLEAETWQVAEWLLRRVSKLGLPADAEGRDSLQPPLSDRDVVAVAFDASAGPDRVLRASEVKRMDRRDLERVLTGAMLLVDRRLGGLRQGLLDEDADDPAPDVSDDNEGVDRVVPFRVRRVEEDDALAPAEGWRVEASFPVRRTAEGESAWLVVESLVDQIAGGEEGRSAARRPQRLDEHQDWTQMEARRLAETLRLPSLYVELLARAAWLHDEGKKATCWQRAFKAPNGGDPPLAKTVSHPDLSILNGYRHELGSLPYAEKDERVNAMPSHIRDLCLHLIAAHHGAARPTISSAGASEPPSRLAARARDIALRYMELQKTWGPWGLAWWETLLRAADQQASRRNDQAGGGHGR